MAQYKSIGKGYRVIINR